jgi:hypothetical protein
MMPIAENNKLWTQFLEMKNKHVEFVCITEVKANDLWLGTCESTASQVIVYNKQVPINFIPMGCILLRGVHVNVVNNICFYLHSQLLNFLLYSTHNMFRPLWAVTV